MLRIFVFGFLALAVMIFAGIFAQGGVNNTNLPEAANLQPWALPMGFSFVAFVVILFLFRTITRHEDWMSFLYAFDPVRGRLNRFARKNGLKPNVGDPEVANGVARCLLVLVKDLEKKTMKDWRGVRELNARVESIQEMVMHLQIHTPLEKDSLNVLDDAERRLSGYLQRIEADFMARGR